MLLLDLEHFWEALVATSCRALGALREPLLRMLQMEPVRALGTPGKDPADSLVADGARAQHLVASVTGPETRGRWRPGQDRLHAV